MRNMRFVGLIVLFMCIGVKSLRAQSIFHDVTEQSGVDFQHVLPSFGLDLTFGTGAAWIDCDSDGDLDLYISQRNGPNHLYRNNWVGRGTLDFTNIAEGDALDIEHDGAGVSVADYDNDGDDDIYLANSDQDVLLQNDGFCNFTDVTAQAFPGFPSFLPGRGTTASWGDLNNDGWLDLYVSNHLGIFYNANISTQDFLFLNNGNSPTTFTNISTELVGDYDEDGIEDIQGLGFIASLTDLDQDGDLDIFATNDCPFGPEDNKIWINDGGLEFTEISDDLGPSIGGKRVENELLPKPDCQNVMGVAVGDPNRDGIQDYFLTNWNEVNETPIFLYNHNDSLIDKTLEVGLKDRLVPDNSTLRITWGTCFIDYDHDMLLDLAVAAGILDGDDESIFSLQPNLLYHNDGIEDDLPQYRRISDEESGFGDFYKGRTLIAGDYDLDGDQDLLLINYGRKAILYQNVHQNDNNWVNIELKGAGPSMSNRNGIGAKIKLSTPDGVTQSIETRSGSSLGGGDDLTSYFGLGQNTDYSVKVEWPSGKETHHDNLPINSRIQLYEENNNSEEITNSPFSLSPNPIADIANVVVNIVHQSNVKIFLLDPSGKEINEVFSRANMQPGSYQFELDVEYLEPGYYFLKMDRDKDIDTIKILKN